MNTLDSAIMTAKSIVRLKNEVATGAWLIKGDYNQEQGTVEEAVLNLSGTLGELAEISLDLALKLAQGDIDEPRDKKLLERIQEKLADSAATWGRCKALEPALIDPDWFGSELDTEN